MNFSGLGFHEADPSGEVYSEGVKELFDGSLIESSEEFIGYVNSEDIMHPEIFSYDSKEAVLTALTAAGEKNGNMFAATVESVDPVRDQVDVMNSMGLDCWVDQEEIEIEDEEFTNVKVYVTNDERYGNGEIELPFDGRHEEHVEIGKFFGYPEDEVQAFEKNGSWPEGIVFEDGRQKIADYEPGTDYTFPAQMLADERGYGEETRKKVDIFIPYQIMDSEESMERAVEEAERRYETMRGIEDRYGVDVLDDIL